MLPAAMLAAAVSTAPPAALPPKSAIARCFATMDGAIYHGDPSDRLTMKADVAICLRGIAQANAMRPVTIAQGPEKLFITGRVLDRTATLSFMGLGDAATASREVKLANLYFRVAAGLRDQSPDYHEAAVANVELTRIQLRTLDNERSLAARLHAHTRIIAAYHKL